MGPVLILSTTKERQRCWREGDVVWTLGRQFLKTRELELAAPLRCVAKGNKNAGLHKNLSVVLAALCIVAKNWRQASRSSAAEWMNQVGYVRRKDCRPTERSELLTHAAAWMNPGNIPLSERSQLQSTPRCRIPCV